jgi:hypothetical protein
VPHAARNAAERDFPCFTSRAAFRITVDILDLVHFNGRRLQVLVDRLRRRHVDDLFRLRAREAQPLFFAMFLAHCF